MTQAVSRSGGRPTGRKTARPTQPVERRRPPRPFPWVTMLLAFIMISGAAAAGYWAYPRYFVTNPTCAMPTPGPNVPPVAIGTDRDPMRIVRGGVARLDRPTNPIAITGLALTAELRDVVFQGGIYGRQIVPQHGTVKKLIIDGKNIPLRAETIEAGCIDAMRLGKTIVLFSGAERPTVTVVLTEEQIARLR